MLFKKMRNRQEHQERLRKRDRELLTEELKLSFNDDYYALATPEFWEAWRGSSKTAVIREFAPAKYPASQLGLPGEKPVWVVFVNKTAKAFFEEKVQTITTPSGDEEIKGLGWQSLRANEGMFLDDRQKTGRSQRPLVVAWLNHNREGYSVNVVHTAFKLTHPIPTAIADLGDAVDWVYKHSAWNA